MGQIVIFSSFAGILGVGVLYSVRGKWDPNSSFFKEIKEINVSN